LGCPPPNDILQHKPHGTSTPKHCAACEYIGFPSLILNSLQAEASFGEFNPKGFKLAHYKAPDSLEYRLGV
jgi:hypothetical protein